jgi:hypothetical protein
MENQSSTSSESKGGIVFISSLDIEEDILKSEETKL